MNWETLYQRVKLFCHKTSDITEISWFMSLIHPSKTAHTELYFLLLHTLIELNQIYFAFSKSKTLQNHWICNMSTENIFMKYTTDISIILVQNISKQRQ